MYIVNESANIVLQSVGHDKIPVVIIDDFLLNGEELKNNADSLQFDAEKVSYYPGLRYPIDPHYGFAFVRSASDLLSKIFQVNVRNISAIESYYSMVLLHPDKLSPYQKIPHYDFALKKGVAAIHYLCDGRHGGTSFYRHRATGYEYIDRDRFTFYDEILSNELLESGGKSAGYILDSTKEFEKIGTVSAKFNRLVLYPGCVLHSGDIVNQYSLDPSTQTGRLTITSFIHAKQN